MRLAKHASRVPRYFRAMPELPELEALAQALDPLVGRAEIAAPPFVHFAVGKTHDPPFAGLAGHRFVHAGRRAKRMLFEVDDGSTLVVHLMTAGRLAFVQPGEKKPGNAVLSIAFTDGSELVVFERATRRSVRVGLYTAEALEAELAGLGPEPLDPSFDVAALKLQLARGGQLHSFLRDQRAIAGIGRAYANEILHAARLSPFAAADRLDDEEVQRLHTAIRIELSEGLEAFRQFGARMAQDKKATGIYHVHRRAGEPCPRCREPLQRVDFAEHEVVYCPACQTGGKVYADRRRSRLLK
ncbi:MAG: formamidopyrimidine-DNA glycosylase [Solirubrobacteraceae bacterium]|nr:formamidopyrimidine-DNA glycosylase [Solirubrobacteraceae bacterium]